MQNTRRRSKRALCASVWQSSGLVKIAALSLAALAACTVNGEALTGDPTAESVDAGEHGGGHGNASHGPSHDDADASRDASSIDAGAPQRDAGTQADAAPVVTSDAGSATDSATTRDASNVGTGNTHCAPAPTSTLVVSVKDKGAKGDGTTDDTAAFQAAVDQVAGTGGTVSVPAGTYMIDALRGVSLGSNMTFAMDAAATLETITNGAENYNLLVASNQSGLAIVGGTLVGDRSTHTGTTGEWGMGVSIGGSHDVFIDGVTVKDFWGDGIYLSSASASITVCSVLADNNRRQGLSIVGADGVVIKDSTFQNTHGTEPQSGIDIEPNAGSEARHESITNCTFSNNAGAGILMYGGAALISDVTVSGNTVSGSGNNGAVTLSTVQTASITGNTLQDSNNWGVALIDGTSGVTVTGNDITVSGGASGHAVDNQGTNNTVSGNTVH